MPQARERRFAVISVGTNSCRLLLGARPQTGAPRIEYHETRGTRLGEGVDEHRRISAEAIERTLEAVRDYAALAREADEVFAIGTSALRDAANAREFLDAFAATAGVPLEILSGEEEAAASFDGAVYGLMNAGRTVSEALTVVDVGGGSTEFAVRHRRAEAPALASLQIGAVRLTEQFLRGDPPAAIDVERCKQMVRGALRGIGARARPTGMVVAVGGTANTAAKMLQAGGISGGDGAVVDLPVPDLEALLKATVSMPVRERLRLRGLPAQRADIFPAGLIVLEAVAHEAAVDRLVVCQSDLLLGYVMRRAGT